MTTPHPSDLGSQGLRVSDSEREQAAADLARHHSDGRLDSSELASRLELTYAARTRGELEALVADLPRTPQPGPAPVPNCRRPPVPVLVLAVLAVLAVAGMVAGSAFGHHRGFGGGHDIWGAWWLVLAVWWVVRPWGRRYRRGPTGRYPRGWRGAEPWSGRIPR